MTTRDLIKRLKENKIDVSLAGNDLEVNFDGDELPEALIDELRSNKASIIRFLKEIHGVEAEPIPALPPQASYGLSSPQHRLWLVSQFEEANVAYNNTGVCAIIGDLNMEAMRHACNALIDRHEILRTVLREDERGELRQFILTREESGFNLVYKDLRGEQDPVAAVNQLLHSTAAEPMDLTKGPLLRVEIYHIAEGQWALNYIMHHIISDGWSAGIFTNDISLLYYGYLGGNRNPLPPLRIQYKDYAAWQQAQLSGEQLEIHKGYWMGQFEGELPILELTGDRPRPPVKTYNGQTTSKQMVNAALTKAIKGLAQEQGGTLFMGLLTTVNILLYRYTGQEDIIIGFPVAGRDHPDLENQIGFYINNLALRTRFSGNDTVRELLRKVKQVTLGAYEHQVYPFEELLENLDLERDASRSPLFNIVAVMHNAKAAATSANNDAGAGEEQSTHAMRPGDIALTGFPSESNPVSKFDITFNFGELEEELFIELEYNTDLFNQGTIDRMMMHLAQIISAATAQPDMPIAQLDFLTEAEKEQLTAGFNQTALDYPRAATVVQLFEAHAAAQPESPAVVEGDTVLGYGQLNERANQLAAALHHQGIGPGHTVAVQIDRSISQVVAILGILKAGAAFLPIDPTHPAGRIDHMLSDSGSQLVLTAQSVESLSEGFGTANPSPAAGPNDLAYLIYTSGSTGLPKGVMVQHKALANLCAWHLQRFALTAADRCTLYAGVSFDASVWELFPPLAAGASLYVVPPHSRLDMAALSDFYVGQQITVGFLPTPVAEQLMRSGGKGPQRCLLTGGDKLNHFVPLAGEVVNNYGPTENTVVATSGRVEGEQWNIPIGRPIGNVQVYVLDKAGQLCPIGVPGQLYVAGDSLALGYQNQPQLTEERFVDCPFGSRGKMYQTGDLVRWLPNGDLAFMGRLDEQVKVLGHRIELGEIETVLQSHPLITAAAVVAKNRPNGEKALVAYLVSPQPIDPQEVRQQLGLVLPAYMVPAYYLQLPSLPLTANGKVDRAALPEPDNMEAASSVPYVPPRHETEEKLIAIWEEVLGRKNIGIKDNFFDLGGNSINSIQIVARLKQVGYSITIKDVLLHPVVEDLASRMAHVLRLPDQETVTGMIPLSPIQQFFFQMPFEQRHHYNQAVLLEGKDTISETHLRAVLDKIVLHHDALRMVCRPTEGGWVQENKGAEQGYGFEVLTKESDEQFVQDCERIQSSFDLANGPLLKAALFHGKESCELLLVIHHLVVDGVSWRILFEDLSSLYQQAMAGQPLSLPLKTDSFQYWQQRQVAFAHSKALQQEAAYWQAIEDDGLQPLPMDNPTGANTMADAASGSFMLDETTTDRLLTRCYKAYQTDVNDILISALSLAMAEVFDMQKLLITMEGHGRENIGGDEDVTRTVGWFTTMYPVALNLQHRHDMVQQLISVKESLHRVPNKGIGYGILRYLGQQPYRLSPQVSFNYLGDFGSGVKAEDGQQLFTFSGNYHGQVSAPTMPRNALLEVNGMIVSGKISLSVTYSHQQYQAATIEKLLLAYQRHLMALIEKLASVETVTKTPVDFTYKGLSMEDLQKLSKLK